MGEVACLSMGEIHLCFWCTDVRLVQEVLPRYEGKDYEFFACPDCGTGYAHTDTSVVFVMPASQITAEWLWKTEQQYKRRISKPGGGNDSTGKRKKLKSPLSTERYRLE